MGSHKGHEGHKDTRRNLCETWWSLCSLCEPKIAANRTSLPALRSSFALYSSAVLFSLFGGKEMASRSIGLRHHMTSVPIKGFSITMVLALFFSMGVSGGGRAKNPASQAGDWQAYGHDAGGTRYSPLTQINRDNVKGLKVAWEAHTGALEVKGRSTGKAAFEATPIFVDGTLYLSTPFGRVIALDPVTGKERWAYDPKINLWTSYSEMTSRGVSTWVDERLKPGAPNRRRIILATLDARLIALDAATGLPCKEFGQDGQVDLTKDVRFTHQGDYQVTSPPAVIGDRIVVGSSMGDNRGVEVERGVVRAYDARTGRL